MAQRTKQSSPQDVRDIQEEIKKFYDTEDEQGRKIGNAFCGIYAFYDYEGEPIYVGQTIEKVRGRIGRHLTGRRSDAVGKFVLDPVEVAEVEVWPFFDISPRTTDEKKEAKLLMDKAEYTVFEKLLQESAIGAILNEEDIPPTEPIELPKSHRARIIPAHIYAREQHPDVRTARRASTIASLARLISERNVSLGLRQTLLTQAKRLEWLADRRLDELDI